MPVYRKTAIVQLELPSGAMESSLPLTSEREYGVILSIAGRTYPAQSFHSPINDEQWREFIRQLRACNVNRDEKTGYRGATAIRALARSLYQSLAQLSPALREFLEQRKSAAAAGDPDHAPGAASAAVGGALRRVGNPAGGRGSVDCPGMARLQPAAALDREPPAAPESAR